MITTAKTMPITVPGQGSGMMSSGLRVGKLASFARRTDLSLQNMEKIVLMKVKKDESDSKI